MMGFPGSSDGKVSACTVGDPGSIPGSGRSPGEGNGNSLQYSCLENPMDGGAWWATVHRVTKNRTRLSNFTHSTYDAWLLIAILPHTAQDRYFDFTSRFLHLACYFLLYHVVCVHIHILSTYKHFLYMYHMRREFFNYLRRLCWSPPCSNVTKVNFPPNFASLLLLYL